MDPAYVFFAANYLAQGLIGIAYEPIYYLQKDVLHLGPAQSAAFASAMSFPFLIKPLFGFLVDPLRGGRARAALLAAAALATSVGWLILAALRGYAYGPTLALLTLVNVGIIVCDVACDAVMVERGQALAKTGVYQAVQIFFLYTTLVATGIGGGWVSAHLSYRAIFALTAAFPLLIVASLPFSETRALSESRPPVWSSLGALIRSKGFWRVSALIFLYNFNPFKGTAFFYYQSGPLGFSKTLIGTLTSVGGAAGMAGAALFGRACARVDSERLARAGVAAGVLLTALYLAYLSPASALVLTALTGAAEVFFRLSMMDLAARACPHGAEATGFALFMSVFNLTAWASNAAGGVLYERWSSSAGAHGAMAGLILLSALMTAACWPLTRPPENAA